jgi:hypothetical protein
MFGLLGPRRSPMVITEASSGRGRVFTVVDEVESADHNQALPHPNLSEGLLEGSTVEDVGFPGGIESFFLLFMLLFIVVPIIGIIDAALIPDSAWVNANQNKIVWIVVQIFLGIFGAAAYFVAIRPKLKAGSVNREQRTTL